MNEIIRLYLTDIIRHSLVLLVLVFSLSFPDCRTSVEMTPETWVAFSEDTKVVILGTLHEGIPIMGNLPTFIMDAIIGAEIVVLESNLTDADESTIAEYSEKFHVLWATTGRYQPGDARVDLPDYFDDE